MGLVVATPPSAGAAPANSRLCYCNSNRSCRQTGGLESSRRYYLSSAEAVLVVVFVVALVVELSHLLHDNYERGILPRNIFAKPIFTVDATFHGADGRLVRQNERPVVRWKACKLSYSALP